MTFLSLEVLGIAFHLTGRADKAKPLFRKSAIGTAFQWGFYFLLFNTLRVVLPDMKNSKCVVRRHFAQATQ